MKKVFALLMMTVMVMSLLPLALARNGSGNDSDDDMMDRLREAKQERLENMESLAEQQRERLMEMDAEMARKLYEHHEDRIAKLAGLDADQLERLAALDRARLQKFLEDHEDDLEDAIDDIKVKKVKKEDAFRNRNVSEKHMEQAKERFKEAKMNYGQAKKLFEEHKDAWEDAIEDGDDEAAIEHAKEYLHYAAQMVIDSLEQVKEQAAGNDDLTPEEYEEIVVDVDAKIVEMEALQERLELAETKEEVKAVGADILAAWERMRERVRVHAENVVRTQVGEILSRSEALEQHLDRILAEMEAENVSVDDLDEKLDAFSVLVESAREKFANSSDLFEEAKEFDDREAFEESKELAREAHEDLKEAHKILMEIVREVKSEGYEVEDDDEYVEVVEIDDAEEDALDELSDAQRAIDRAETRIAAWEADGLDVSDRLALIDEAKDLLVQAQAAFDDEDFESAEDLAKQAEDLAKDAREDDADEEDEEEIEDESEDDESDDDSDDDDSDDDSEDEEEDDDEDDEEDA